VRVVVDARYLSDPFGSMTVYCGNLLRALTEMNLGIPPVALLPRELDPSAHALRDELGSQVHWVRTAHDPFRDGSTLAAELRWVHKEVPRLLARDVPDADVLVMTYHHPPARTPGVARVAVVHDLCGLGLGFPRTKKAYRRHYLRLRAAAHLPEMILPISYATRDVMLERFPASSNRMGPVIYNAVHRRPVSDEAVASTMAAHGLRQRAYVVAFATWQARKNFEATLDALTELRRRGRPLRLVGIAPAKERDSVIERCRADGHQDAIILSGVPDEMLDSLYAGALALVWPSVCEGFGYPVVEAMAQGCPPLVWSVGPGAELIGSTLAPLPSLAPTSIADRLLALQTADTDQREKLGQSLKDRTQAFSTAAYQDGLLQALQRARDVQRSGRPRS
jgi:glycosyltransferase involved in cell wall biosynthesis